ncbi:MAG: protein NO VEIN domain-containing protein [Aminipila sp.]
MYKIPDEYYIRIHHVRPRFKNDIENVLLYMSGEISKLPALSKDEFATRMNEAIYKYPGNITKKLKTINNWRTEISALFGFMISDATTTKPGIRAVELFESEDLVESFKKFLYSFQYPGAHIKAHEVKNLIEAGVRFKPAQTILKVMQKGEELTGKRVGFSKAEVCHCMFNDVRCVRGTESPENTWARIAQNRQENVEYDTAGDIIRYAGDILDYMEIANLLITYDSKTYYINSLENEAILKFVNSTEWFTEYDEMIKHRTATLEKIHDCEVSWFNFVNRDLSTTDFATDILAFISEDSKEYEELKKQTTDLFESKLESDTPITTKDIGDMGEGLVYGHECQRVKVGGRLDLVHLIQKIPTKFAVGYDIQSVETDERKRYIEVKTTISLKPLHFNKIHLTPNEWNTATTMKDRYFVYRLAISKKEKKLFIIQDPVQLYKNDLLEMVPRDGAEIVFDINKSGQFEELLAWAN